MLQHGPTECVDLQATAVAKGKAAVAKVVPSDPKVKTAVAQGVDALEQEAGVLDFVELHFEDHDGRPGHPALAEWFQAFREGPAMAATRPVQPSDAA